MVKTKLVWEKELVFAVEQDGYDFHVDANPEYGGQEMGPRPKGLVLTALAGCSGMDAVSMLTKMRVSDYKLAIEVEGETVNEHPKVFKNIDLIFRFEGEELPLDKLQRAVELATEKYCAVHAMLTKAVTIHTKIFLNGKEV